MSFYFQHIVNHSYAVNCIIVSDFHYSFVVEINQVKMITAETLLEHASVKFSTAIQLSLCP